MRYNMNSGWGLLEMVRATVQVPVLGKILLVIPSTDANFERYNQMLQTTRGGVDPDGVVRIYTTLEAAYAAARTNRDDVIVLAGQGTHTVAAGIAWSKSRIHVIGMDGGDRLVQQGTKVQSTDAAADAYVLKVTGTRNTFHNIKFIQADRNAAALNVLQEGGEGSLYKNCSFVFGVVDNLSNTSASEVLSGSDSATFLNCLFGTETLLTSVARAVFTIDQVTASQEFKSNILKDCIFMISSSSADALLLKVAANTDVLFTNLFINPIMMASLDTAGGIALTIAASSAGSLTKGTINFANLATFNCASFSTTSDQFMITGNIPTAATSGIAVTPA